MSEKLKPCPFCGSEANLYECKWLGVTSYGVECTKCKGLVDRCSTKKEAIKAWNRRANDES